MAYEFQLRRDTAANWTANNPVLHSGEPGLETDTDKLKFGDGVTTWTSLAYFAGNAAGTAASALNTSGTASNPVTIYSAARPTGLTVVWWACATQPTNLALGDIWLDTYVASTQVVFNNTVGNWTGTYANSTVASSTVQEHGAVASLAVTATAAATSYGLDSTSAGRVAVTAGTQYTVTMYFYATAASRQAQVGVQFYNSGGTLVSGGTVSAPTVTLTQNAWTTITTTFTVPATATLVEADPSIQVVGAASNVPASDLTYISAV